MNYLLLPNTGTGNIVEAIFAMLVIMILVVIAVIKIERKRRLEAISRVQDGYESHLANVKNQLNNCHLAKGAVERKYNSAREESIIRNAQKEELKKELKKKEEAMADTLKQHQDQIAAMKQAYLDVEEQSLAWKEKYMSAVNTINSAKRFVSDSLKEIYPAETLAKHVKMLSEFYDTQGLPDYRRMMRHVNRIINESQTPHLAIAFHKNCIVSHVELDRAGDTDLQLEKCVSKREEFMQRGVDRVLIIRNKCPWKIHHFLKEGDKTFSVDSKFFVV
jgi:competence protein ComGC